jgi:tRNA A37 threonylcarbamoyladenosine dehydratase
VKLHRAEGLLDVNAIAQRVLVVIGLGSLGSQVLSYLAYPWEQIWLVDPQALSIENIERHVLGISAVGQPKTAGMRDWLIDRGVNPARIKTMATGFAEALVEVPSEALVVASIDDHHARVALSGACGTWDVPLVAGGIYPKGAGADIAVLPHPDVICYGCTGPLTMCRKLHSKQLERDGRQY